MHRTIVGFHQDEEGHWVAELDCLHSQHVRHQPPFWDRPWVLSESTRSERIGSELDCPLCDRAELPDALEVVRTAGPFDADTVPAGLRAEHTVPAGTWGRLRVLDGRVGFAIATSPPLDVQLAKGDQQAIPPGVPHHVLIDGDVVIAIDFLKRPSALRR